MYRKETWEDTGGGSTQEGPEERDKEKGGETERRVEKCSKEQKEWWRDVIVNLLLEASYKVCLQD